MTDLLAAVLVPIWAYWLNICINLDHACKPHAYPSPLHTHNVDVCANLRYAGVICALAQQRHVVLVVFIVPVITGRMQDIIGYDCHNPLSTFIEQAHCNQRMCFSSGMHGKYSLASVWWWWKVNTCVMVLPSHSCISENHPPTPPHTHLHTHTNTEIAT